jgi:hypothetical protein
MVDVKGCPRENESCDSSAATGETKPEDWILKDYKCAGEIPGKNVTAMAPNDNCLSNYNCWSGKCTDGVCTSAK